MPQLDGVRAIAALMVLFCHFAPGYPHIWWIGVLLFFTLSGFLITGILLDLKAQTDDGTMSRSAAFGRFYYRRSLRIFPLYFMVVAAACWIGLAGFREHWEYHVFYMSNMLSGPMAGYASHFWTLCIEEQFYLLWPLLVFLLPSDAIRTALVSMVALAFAYRFCNNRLDFELNGRLLFGSLDSLSLGGLLAMAHRQPAMPRALSVVFSPVAMFCFFAGTIVFSKTATSTVPYAFPNIGVWHQPELFRVCSALFGGFTCEVQR